MHRIARIQQAGRVRGQDEASRSATFPNLCIDIQPGQKPQDDPAAARNTPLV
jgi:hypothetical protein